MQIGCRHPLVFVGRRCVAGNAGLVFLLALTANHPAHAQPTYPTKPVRLIVAQTAGGNSDMVARAYAQRLSERFGQPIVVDNRGGASGIVATELVVNAQPDGYTLLLAPTAHAINPSVHAKLPYDTLRDVKAISLLGIGYETSSWQGLFGPAKLPLTLVDRLHREVAAIAKSADIQKRLSAEGLLPQGTSPQEFEKFITAEIAKWGRVTKAAGIAAR